MAIPTAPSDLQREGRALWRAIQSDYDLEAHEAALLRAACRTVDRLEAIAAALVTSPLTVMNGKGEEITQPLLVEQRMASQALARLLASLRLPQGDEDDASRPQRRSGMRSARGLRSIP